MTYTPGTPNTKPGKYVLPTYVNTPEIKGFTRQVNAYEINKQHANLKDLRISGFHLVFKGMTVNVQGGVCILPDGQKLTHTGSIFYIDRDLPTQKTEVFYLAMSLARRHIGEAVTHLFNKRPSDDWRILKIITIPIGSENLSNAKVKNNFRFRKFRIYNYVPCRPAGAAKIIKVPFLINSDSIKIYADGDLISNMLVTVKPDKAFISLPELDIAESGDYPELLMDFDILF